MDTSMQMMSFAGNLPAVSKPMADWSVHEVVDFLGRCSQKLGVKTGEYQRLVQDNDIDGEVLRDLEDDDLQRLGIKSFGHRSFIAKLIKHYNPGMVGQDKRLYGSKSSDQASQSDTSVAESKTSAICPSNYMAPVAPVEERFSFSAPKYSESFHATGVRAFVHAEASIQKAALRIHESKIRVLHKIGTGSVATVYAGTYESHKVAIKKHNFEQMDGKSISDLELEVGKMTAVNHPCIVRCFGMLEPTAGIVLELVEGGSVFEIIHSAKGESYPQYHSRLPWDRRLSFLLDACYGLRAIHGVGMIHGDFKTLNLLVTREGRVKVADFGLSKLLGTVSIVPGTKTISGTPQYMAPEVMHCKPQGLRVDMYSVGIVMWEILTGTIPWKDMDYVQIIQRVTHSSNETQRPPPGRPPVDEVYRSYAPSGYIQVLEDCWAHEPKQRPSAGQCVEYLEEVRRRVMSTDASNAHHQRKHDGLQFAGHRHDSFQEGKRPNEPGSDRRLSNEAPGKRARMEGGQGDHVSSDLGGHPNSSRQSSNVPMFENPLEPPRMFVTSGGMSVLADMLRSGNVDRGMQAMTSMIEMCINNPHGQQAVHDQRILNLVFPFLEAWDRSNLQVKAANCTAVCTSNNVHNRINLVKNGAIAIFVRMLSTPQPEHQEAACHNITNLVKRPTESEQQALMERGEDGTVNTYFFEAQEELNRLGGIEKLTTLMEKSMLRVKSAAAAAVANSMTACQANRTAFQEANGVQHLISMMRYGDVSAAEHATMALWNAMVDTPETLKDFNRLNGSQPLILMLNIGTSLGRELSAGAIWKACANDDSDKQLYTPAVEGLVKLLRSSSARAHEQASGALRSLCVNSPANKLEVNRVNGVSALVHVLSSSELAAREQAGAALANACANCYENQIAARHAGAVHVLVEELQLQTSPSLLECSLCAMRNLCINCLENQEELSRCNGMIPLLKLLHSCMRQEILEVVASTLVKACSLCPSNLQVLRTQYGVQNLRFILSDENAGGDIKAHIKILVEYLERIEPST